MKYYSHIVDSIISFSSPIIFEFLFRYFINNNYCLGKTIIFSFGFIFLYIVISMVIFNFLMFIFICVSGNNKISFFMASLGKWIQFIDKPSGRAVSIAYITYNPINFKFIYKGSAYDINGEKQARWNCNTLIYDRNDTFTFLGTGSYKNPKKSLHTVGYIEFDDKAIISSKKYIRGTGMYCDYDVEEKFQKELFSSSSFRIERFKPICKKYIMKDKPHNDNELKKVIIGYYKDKCSFDTQVSKTELNI